MRKAKLERILHGCMRLNNKRATLIPLHGYADNSGIYTNRHLRDAFVEDLLLFAVDSRLKDCGNDDPEPST